MKLNTAVNFWNSCFSVPASQDVKEMAASNVATIAHPNHGDVIAALLSQRGFSSVEVYLITLTVKRFTADGYFSECFETYVSEICDNFKCGERRRNVVLNIADQLICNYHASNDTRWVA